VTEDDVTSNNHFGMLYRDYGRKQRGKIQPYMHGGRVGNMERAVKHLKIGASAGK
jgi:hypothetical protein